MRRRPITLIAGIIVALGLALGLYFAFFANSAELVVTDNPFGQLGSEFGGDVPADASGGAGTEYAPRLIRISERPVAEGVAAFTVVSTTTRQTETASGTPATQEIAERDTEVRFIDRASGNIYKYLAWERSLTRISNKTLPGIQRASWLPDGSMAYVQFLSEEQDRVATYALPDSGEGGFFLEQDLAQATAVGSSTLFTLLSGTTGSVGSVAKRDGTGARTLFTSLISSLTVHPTRSTYFAHTKPSIALGGYAFQINATTGVFTRLLGPMRGLSVLPSPDNSKLLYSYIDQGSLRLAVLDTNTRSTITLPVQTLADKCAWASDSRIVYCGVPLVLPRLLPDDWYQGAASFSDRIWRIDMNDRLATLVLDPGETADLSIDAVALKVDESESFLIFTDKKTGSLWSYEL
jgi:hypothetical protein